jgi:hypothetical protein
MGSSLEGGCSLESGKKFREILVRIFADPEHDGNPGDHLYFLFLKKERRFAE